MSRLLKTGSNCDCIENAERVRFLVDGNQYFHALREAIKRAQHAVYILSWDIDSNVSLQRNGIDDGYPVQLGKFLNAVATEKPGLNIYLLNWDFTVLLMLNREFLPIYKFDWTTHDRVHFHLNDQLPSGASQHQKVVVIDDTLAFVGGLDITKERWDTSDHLPFDEKRDKIGDKPSRPYHDIQAMIAGDCARALGDMARQNWLNSTNHKLPVIESVDIEQLWPETIPADIKQIPVGISYTSSKFNNRQEIRQIQQLYIDAILSAKKYVYIENQYFTTPSVGNAIKHQLEKSDGPEIILIIPKITDSWLSQYTMDTLRVRLLQQLKMIDKNDRLRVFYPNGPGLDQNPIIVHSKLMIVDDNLITVGSANLNNRSMALDNECNIAIHAENNQEVQHEVVDLRNRLLAEHLGCDKSKVEKTLNEKNSLIATVEALRNSKTRYLNDLPLVLPEGVDQFTPDIEIVDPEHPIALEEFIKRIIPEKEQAPARKHILGWISIVTILFILAGIWHWTPLKEWANLETISAVIEQIRNLPAAPVLVIVIFVIAGLVAFPYFLLIIACVIAFGSLWGFILSLVGGTLSAIVAYGLGYYTGRKTIRRLAGKHLSRINNKLAQHGVLTIIALRLVPVAPFTIVNLIAGASHIKFRDFLIGTPLGMAPGMLATTLLIDRLEATIMDPNITNLGFLFLTLCLVVLAGYGLVKSLKRHTQKEPKPAKHN